VPVARPEFVELPAPVELRSFNYATPQKLERKGKIRECPRISMKLNR
jgi:hypothetical protein